jgi:hypothetical protein
MNIKAFEKNKFNFLFFTNFETLFFVFIFSDSSFGAYYASPDQASQFQICVLELWNPK